MIFIPFLTLSADELQKFTCADETVEVQHLDELYEAMSDDNCIDDEYVP